MFLYSFLRPGKLRAHAHQETKHIITKPKCPVYDETLIFEKVTKETLSTDHVLEVTVWDAKFTAQAMGVLRLGPRPNGIKPWMDSQVSRECCKVLPYMDVYYLMLYHEQIFILKPPVIKIQKA